MKPSQNEKPDGTNGKRLGIGTWNKRIINAATWKVRTMLVPGRMIEVANEMQKAGVNILALQEVRWVGQERIDKKDFTMFYSEPKTRTGQGGTGFIIDSVTRKSLIYFEPINERMCKLRLRSKLRNVSLITVYAPTEESNEEEKTKFYSQLCKECEKTPKYDTLIILGDFNAKIGTEDFLKDVARKFTLHLETNDNENSVRRFSHACSFSFKFLPSVFLHSITELYFPRNSTKIAPNIETKVDHIVHFH